MRFRLIENIDEKQGKLKVFLLKYKEIPLSPLPIPKGYRCIPLYFSRGIKGNYLFLLMISLHRFQGEIPRGAGVPPKDTNEGKNVQSLVCQRLERYLNCGEK